MEESTSNARINAGDILRNLEKNISECSIEDLTEKTIEFLEDKDSVHEAMKDIDSATSNDVLGIIKDSVLSGDSTILTNMASKVSTEDVRAETKKLDPKMVEKVRKGMKLKKARKLHKDMRKEMPRKAVLKAAYFGPARAAKIITIASEHTQRMNEIRHKLCLEQGLDEKNSDIIVSSQEWRYHDNLYTVYYIRPDLDKVCLKFNRLSMNIIGVKVRCFIMTSGDLVTPDDFESQELTNILYSK